MEAKDYAEAARLAAAVLHRSRMNGKTTEAKRHLCRFIEACVDRRHDGGVLHVNKADALRNASDMATIFRGGRLRHGNALHVGGVRVKFNWTGGRLFRIDYSNVIIDDCLRRELDRIAALCSKIGTE